MNDQVNHSEELQDDLTVPELNPPGNGETDFIEPVPEEDVELLEGPDIDLPEDPTDAVPVLLSALGAAQANPESGHDFVEDKHRAVFVTDFPQALQEAGRLVKRRGKRKARSDSAPVTSTASALQRSSFATTGAFSRVSSASYDDDVSNRRGYSHGHGDEDLRAG